MRAVSCGVVHLRTAYAIKAHIQTLIILWVIYLQLRDEKFWHKQDALDKKPEEIPAEIWSIIESITKLRQEWKLNIKFPLVNLLGRWNSRLPPLMLRAISFMYAKSISRRLLPDWQDACTDLSEFLLADLRTRGKL